ncbi:MAG: hypothetical protein IKR31_06850 [Prevotella sp.]|nr:hypothetical protein [Prevotella sp.]
MTRNKKHGICDLSGEELISPDRGYDWVSVFTDYIQVKKNRKYGACDLAGNEVAAPLYNNINFAGDIYYYTDAYGKSQPIPTPSYKSPIYASSSASSDSKSTSNSKPRSTYTPRFYTPYQSPIYKDRSSSNRNVRNYNSNRSVIQTGNVSHFESRSSPGSSYRSRTSRAMHSSSRGSSYESDNSRNKTTKTVEQKKCFHCSGSGVVKCSFCRGRGRFTCEACKGTGYWTQKGVRHNCNACYKGSIKCNYCYGKGTRKCTSCSGKGYHLTERYK